MVHEKYEGGVLLKFERHFPVVICDGELIFYVNFAIRNHLRGHFAKLSFSLDLGLQKCAPVDCPISSCRYTKMHFLILPTVIENHLSFK